VVPDEGRNVKSSCGISVLFLDIGGVLLTNGWDHKTRQQAARDFELDYEEMNDRHGMTFDAYERGLLSLNDYLKRVVFYQERSFTLEQFTEYMFSRSQPIDHNVTFFQRVTEVNGLKVGAISNEGRELTVHRIRTFGLTRLIEFFISSCFVHFRKPDEGIYRLALDIAQVPPERAAYVDDRAMFVEIARNLGIRSIHYRGLEETRRALERLGLEVPNGGWEPHPAQRRHT
jgi:putative hydrolase of the HAD superfamily